MDFGQVLHTAKKNEKLNKNGIKYYSTKFEPPKKEEKKSVQLSENIKKFLARKEAEEKRKNEEDKRRKEELLALRSQDKKATRRVNVMLKRTKSANQSVIDDAVDNDNTAVTLAGPLQPDEDDYGYVSQEASAYYNRMMEKYSKMPDEPKFNMEKKKTSVNLGNTKDRVKAALEREKEEAMMPRKRKRKHKEKSVEDDEDGINYAAPDRSVGQAMDADVPRPKPKPKSKPAPPPINFAELLKIAEQKQHEPIIIEKKEREEEKPLTKKQKKEAERMQDYLKRKEERLTQEDQRGDGERLDGPTRPNKIPKLNSKTSSDNKASSLPTKLGKQSTNERVTKPETNKSSNSSIKSISNSNCQITSSSSHSSDNKHQRSSTGLSKIPKHPVIENNNSTASKNFNFKRPSNSPKQPVSKTNAVTTNKPQVEDARQERRYLPGDIRAKQQRPEDLKPKQFPPADLKPKQNLNSNPSHADLNKYTSKPKQYSPADVKPKQFPPADMKPKQFPPADMKPKQFPPADVRPKHFPPKDVKPKQFPPPDVRRKNSSMLKKNHGSFNKRRVIDDDSEYDSEMDDFIDDGDEEEDVSKYIKDIFGYDKSRYREEEDDIDNMESSFAQQMKEEVISTKIGIMEDLEDIKKEEEQKKRKALLKKKRKL